jgi:hypothetical protein
MQGDIAHVKMADALAHRVIKHLQELGWLKADFKVVKARIAPTFWSRQTPDLLGREDLVSAVKESVWDPDNRCTVLYDHAGVGKRAVASEVATQLWVNCQLRGGVLQVDCWGKSHLLSLDTFTAHSSDFYVALLTGLCVLCSLRCVSWLCRV